MKKKIVNIIEMILQIVTIVLLFVRGMFLVVASNNDSRLYSFSDVCSDGDNKFIFIALLVLFIANFILCLISIISKNKGKDNLLHILIPLIALVIMFISVSGMQDVAIYNVSLFDSSNIMDAIVREIKPLFYITSGLLLSVVVLSVLKRSSLIVPKVAEQPQVINNIQETSNADELKKFKDLLDSGIITQEEFDEKKKQLLGL